eukprot:m.25483 g.25483  ORF g.25483 m.25483 type:complete len:129 (+) comp8726_c1_seq2:339-725(+)
MTSKLFNLAVIVLFQELITSTSMHSSCAPNRGKGVCECICTGLHVVRVSENGTRYTILHGLNKRTVTGMDSKCKLQAASMGYIRLHSCSSQLALYQTYTLLLACENKQPRTAVHSLKAENEKRKLSTT